jgi:hypothetical protein
MGTRASKNEMPTAAELALSLSSEHSAAHSFQAMYLFAVGIFSVLKPQIPSAWRFWTYVLNELILCGFPQTL